MDAITIKGMKTMEMRRKIKGLSVFFCACCFIVLCLLGINVKNGWNDVSAETPSAFQEITIDFSNGSDESYLTKPLSKYTSLWGVKDGKLSPKSNWMGAALNIPIRRIGIGFSNVVDESCEGYDLFTDLFDVEREKKREKAVLGLTAKYGKNALLRGVDYLDCATQRERNTFIGGHRAGDDETGKG